MVAKQSRYAKIPTVVSTNATGHAVASQAVRLLPATPGEFQHTVQESDRLDQLAYRYYKQPQKWWRICDANPTVRSPQALLGQTAWVTHQIPLLAEPVQQVWAVLLENVQTMLGVIDAQLDAQFILVAEPRLVEETVLTLYHEVRQTTLVVTYLPGLTPIDAILDTLTVNGFVAGTPQFISPIGKPIIIPPDSLQ